MRIAVLTIRHEVVLDLDRFAGVDQLVQPQLILFRQKTVLPLFEQLFHLGIHRRQRVDVLLDGIGNLRMAGGGRVGFQLFEALGHTDVQSFEGIRPFGDDFTRFLLAVRPYLEQAVLPCRRAFQREGAFEVIF
ncbi:hypothetical protein SDC9_199471 [bioreactor metagenome]|uniref:Uncharacterized protein n=1 Tax=bioreactor metagenome TaxID=1076179 RepID=A0A645ILV1_9ZZZZ